MKDEEDHAKMPGQRTPISMKGGFSPGEMRNFEHSLLEFFSPEMGRTAIQKSERRRGTMTVLRRQTSLRAKEKHRCLPLGSMIWRNRMFHKGAAW